MKPTSDNNLSERVTQYLIKHIHDNDLKPGDRVPSEVKVSGELKISRGVVRQAYHSLRTVGILEIAMGRSPRVGELRHDSFTPLFSHALTTEQASIEDVLELRFAVEIHAAELAAIHRTEGHVEALKKAVEGMRKNVNDRDRFARIDVRFHQVLGNATGNYLFEIFGRALRTPLESSIRTGLRSRETLAQIEKIVDTHQAIVEAIEAQQPALARKIMERHFNEAKQALRAASKAGRRKLN
jgi:GntR family transcriptional regulator, transcriptional repressor for pyruvate dehydrogenase complex